MTTWILVGDTARAKLFSVELPQQPWTLLAEFSNAGAHATSKELSPTPPGKMKQSGSGKSRHTALEPRMTPKEAEAERFAHQLGERLNSATAGREYDRLLLVAPPHFLGMLRDKLDKQTLKLLQSAVDKDLVMLEDREIRERLQSDVFAHP